MFPLAGKAFPTSTDELAGAIEAALSDVFTLPEDHRVVTTTGGKYPALKNVKINLDGARITATEPPAEALTKGKREPAVTVDKLDLSGQPIHYEQTKLNLKLTGTGLSFEYGRDKANRPLLVLTDAESGKVEAKITQQDIQALLLAAAAVGAKQQGVTVQDLHLELSSDGARSVAAQVRIKAKKLLMSGVLVITGRLDVDDELNATVSNLACKGEGVVGTAVAGFVQKYIQPYDGTTIPLMAFSLGEVKLRDLKISVKDAVQVTAAFGRGK